MCYIVLNARRGLTPRHFVRDSLFAFGGKRIVCFIFSFSPLSAKGEERGDERCNVGVSNRRHIALLSNYST
jgi:hypothetical protein